MATDNDYDEIIEGSWDGVPDKDPVAPDGDYVLVGKNAAFMKATKEGANDRVVFFLGIKEPIEVDQDLLDALPDDFDFGNVEVTYQQWIESPRDWIKVKNTLRKFGVDPAAYASRKDSFAAIRGQETAGAVKTRSYTNKAGEVVTSNQVAAFIDMEA